jgi:tetratricopeptide (TPR) repeat protein
MKKLLFLLLTLSIAITADNMSLVEKAQEHQKNEQFADAIICYKKLLTNFPTNLDILFNLGHCHLALGQGDHAIAAFELITRINPQALPARYNAAYTRKTIGRLPEAIEEYKAIITEYPDYDPAQLALGFAYLAYGDFENGWKQHERYLKASGKNGDALRSLLASNAISGSTILLKPEGGLGDTLLFIRYAERLHNMGAQVIGIVQKPLVPLLSGCPYIDYLLPDNVTRCPHYQADATLMSLPAIFNDTHGTFPNTIPYLFADQTLVDYWKSQLAHDTNFKVGICWEASIHNDESRLPIARRGCPLEQFYTLKNIPGISFYSLQKHDGVDQLAKLPSDFPLHTFDNLDEKLGAFTDTAAIMKNLDLIITVDTAIAHLAGGLGCPIWLLNPLSTDWRWIFDSSESYWYPTMRIFKQQKPFDWNGVMEKVKTELHALVVQ